MFKLDVKKLKPVAMNVGAATAGVVAAGYVKPEIESALGSTVGQYSDEIITVAGTVIAAASSGNTQSKKLVRNFGIGFAIRGLMGVLDKYVFNKSKATGTQTAQRGVNAPHMALPPASILDEPVEVISMDEDPKIEVEMEQNPEGEFEVSIV